jgi:hypothetical protein
MKEYLQYKEHWIKNEAPDKVPSLYWGETAEQAFAQHVNNIGLYGLMEQISKELKCD